MLPLLNLTNPNLIAPDALDGAGSLVPEASDALRGGFANILQSTVRPAALLPAPDGEELPATGNLLPVTAGGRELQLDTEIELPTGDVDLSPLGLNQQATGVQAGDGLPLLAIGTIPDTGGETSPEDGMPVTTHIPMVANTTGPDLLASAADTAGDGLADAMQVPVVTATSNVVERGSRLQDRDRAIDATNARAPGSRHVAGLTDAESAINGRAAVAGDNALPRVLQRQAPSGDDAILTRAPAEPAIRRDETLRGRRGDGLPILQPVQSAAWQQGTVTTELTAESSQRVLGDFSTVLPRATTAASPQALPQLPTAAQTIDIPVQQSGWDSALADRVTLMANGRLQNAELRLSPAELGPLRIQLEIDDGVANVSFQSQHPLTRDALEQAMPRLRELLAENGLSLGQADVGDDGSRQKSGEAVADGRSSLAAGADDDEINEPATSNVTRRAADGLVDTFA